MNQSIINFYSGTGTDDKGRTLQEIIDWCSDDLEGCHDFIQWLFPLDEPSRFNPTAPLLDDETIDAFTNSDVCKQNLVRVTERMLDFYEFKKRKYSGARTLPGRVVWDGSPDGHFIKAREPWWLANNDHNYMRFTRILRSLNLLGLVLYSDMIIDLLTELFTLFHAKIGIETFAYWCEAVGRECIATGPATYMVKDGSETLYINIQ